MNATQTVKPLPEAVITALFNQKGGVGKTMLTMQLGAELALRGYRVLIVDMDIQSTATTWSGNAPIEEPFPATVVSLAAQSQNVIGELKKFSQLFDFILVDCRPALDDRATWAVLHVADMALIPTIPLLDNLWATVEAKEKALEARKSNTALKLFYVPSIVSRGNVFKSGLEVLQSDEEVPTFESYLSQRNGFPECQYMGASIHRLGARGRRAQEEVQRVTDEFLSHALAQ